jgi:hypothetical protein
VTGLDTRLEELVRSSDWLMAALRAVRDVDPPDWLVGGGVLGVGEVAPLVSAADGVGTWPETATAVAIRLLDGDELRVVAPAAWRTCSRWSAGATPGGSAWTTTGAGCARSTSRSAGRRSPSSTRESGAASGGGL